MKATEFKTIAKDAASNQLAQAFAAAKTESEPAFNPQRRAYQGETLLSANRSVSCDTWRSGLNNNVLVLGSSGDGSHKKRPQIAALVVLLVVLVCAAIAGGAYLVWQNAQIAKSAEEAATTPEPEAPTTSQDAADPRVENPIDFASLRLENPDIYAWIYIPGTDVNYPVVQHPTDDTFYLKHNKDGEWSEEGAIYTQLANKTDFSDPVTVIYGHNLVQGTMFTTLHRFENKDFFDSHEDMYLYTDGHILTYRVIAAYQYDNRHILNSFNFSDPTVVQQYFDSILSPDSLVENVREGTTLTSSDKIVQLSTCTGDSNHIVRRYLVTGVLVSDQPTY